MLLDADVRAYLMRELEWRFGSMMDGSGALVRFTVGHTNEVRARLVPLLAGWSDLEEFEGCLTDVRSRWVSGVLDEDLHDADG